MIRLETGKINEVSHVLFVDRLIVLFTSYKPKAMRRNEGIATASHRVKNVAWKIYDSTHQKARLKSREKPLGIGAAIHRFALKIKFGPCGTLKQTRVATGTTKSPLRVPVAKINRFFDKFENVLKFSHKGVALSDPPQLAGQQPADRIESR